MKAPMLNPYELLGVDRLVATDDLKRAYRKLVREWHPDVRPPEEREEATVKMEELNFAYELLSDPEQRSAYDLSIGLFRCADHPARRGVERCSVCGMGVCAECVRTDGKHLFCPGHAPEGAWLTDDLGPPEQKPVAARLPCWLHVNTISVINCLLCKKPLCSHCVVFLGSDRYCNACAAAARKAQGAAVTQTREDLKQKEQDAIRARQALRNMARPE